MNDGGPVYPIDPVRNRDGVLVDGGSTGLSLRDYFAAAVLNQMYAYEMNIFGPERIRSLMDGRDPHPDDDKHWSVLVARDAYAIADAMLVAREDGPHEQDVRAV